MVSSAPPQDPVDKVRLVLDYVPAEVLQQIADDDEELALLESLDRRIPRDITAKSIRHTTVVVERPARPPVAEIEPPGGAMPGDEEGDDEVPEEQGEILVYESHPDEGELPREVLLLDASDLDTAPVTVVPDEHVYWDEAEDPDVDELAAVGAEPVDVLTFTCDVCGTVYDVEDTGERPLEHHCPGCGAAGILHAGESPDLLVEMEPEDEDQEEEARSFAGFAFVGEAGPDDGWEHAGSDLEEEPEDAEDEEPIPEDDLDLEDPEDADEDEVDDEYTFTPPAADEDEDLDDGDEDEEDLDDLWLDWDEDEDDEDAFDSVDWPEEDEDDAFELVDPAELEATEDTATEDDEDAYDPWGETDDATGEEDEDDEAVAEAEAVTEEEEEDEEIFAFELDEDEEPEAWEDTDDEDEEFEEFESLGEVTDEDEDLPMALPWDDGDEVEDPVDDPEDVESSEDPEEAPEEAEADPEEELDDDATSFEVPPEEAELADAEEEQGVPRTGVSDDEQDDGIPVGSLPGVGSIYADHLDDAGIRTTRDLLGEDPWNLSQDTDISSELVDEWIRISELIHHVGIAQVYAEILAKVGVEGSDDLMGRDAEDLAQAVNRYIASSEGSDAPPPITAEQVERWRSSGTQDA